MLIYLKLIETILFCDQVYINNDQSFRGWELAADPDGYTPKYIFLIVSSVTLFSVFPNIDGI